METSGLAKQLDYKKVPYMHPTYRMNKLLPQSGSQTVAVSGPGGIDTMFEIPVKAFNLNRSYLTFKVTPATGGLTVAINWAFQDCIAPIRQMQLYTRSGIYLCDINELANYTKIMWKPDTKIQEFLDYDKFLNGSGIGRYLTPSNALGTSTAPFAKRHDDSAATTHYIEPKYLEPGTDTLADPVFNVHLPLGMIKNTIFALDKDLYLGEIIILRIVWNTTAKMFLTAGSATDPRVAPTGAGTTANYTGIVTIANLAFYLAVEKNQEVVNQLLSQVNSGGLNVLIPYVYTFKNNLGSTSQTVSIRFNRGHGRKLKKIYHSIFNNTENATTAYDHDERANAKVQVFYTMLDNERLQEFNLATTTFDDYIIQEPKLKGSILQTSDIYYYNWVWIEDWTGLEDKTTNPKDTQILETGLDLTTERKWEFYGITMTNAFFNHYSFAVTEKILTITTSGITVS